MKLKKKMPGILIGVIIFVMLAFSMLIFKSTPSVKLSCENGSFVGFGSENLPLACMACISCSADIKVKDSDGNLICDSGIKSDGRIISIPCSDLKNYKGEEVSITYSVNYSGDVLSFNNQTKVVYNG